jgi:2-phospho-L-lactate guanylyltransferase
VWAVVVARTGPTAKSRLAPVMDPLQRQDLARAMLREVLRTCGAAGFGGTVVVTDTEPGRMIARLNGAEAVVDPGRGLNAAVTLGIEAASGAQAVLVLPGDVPLVTPADLEAMLQAADAGDRVAVVVPDAAGRGTNALLLRPPRLIAPAFGDGSCERHLEAARRVASAVRLERPRLAIDVDEPPALASIPLLTR